LPRSQKAWNLIIENVWNLFILVSFVFAQQFFAFEKTAKANQLDSFSVSTHRVSENL
jgi:hypothetical protein